MQTMLLLNATPRTELGKKGEALRTMGKLPIVAYGPKDASRSLAVSAVEFKKVWQKAGESAVVLLKIGGELQ